MAGPPPRVLADPPSPGATRFSLAKPAGGALPPGPSALPKRVGPFTILERVASFPFTVTYRAEQRGLGRTVLVKTLKPSVSASSPFAVELEREAKILALFDHEGTPKLHDFVRAEDAVYLVLEDTRARPIEALLASWAASWTASGTAGGGKNAPDLDLAFAIFLGGARALAHVHGRGVAHLAVSASSVQIAAPGRVLVTNFQAAETKQRGLPALAEAARADTTEASEFLAPEQILGEEAGAPADVWALGILGHLLVTGAHPFASEDPHETVARIRTAAPAALPRALPTAFARALARCLAKNPRDRFSDAADLTRSLEAGAIATARGPLTVVLSRAAATLGLGEALDAPGKAPQPGAAPSFSWARPAVSLGLVMVLGLVGQLVIRLLDDRDAGEGDGVAESPAPGTARRDAGLLRVVARPWAEVYVDGELADTTPVGKPIAVTPGRHFVTFRHPNAPDEQRSIKIAAGQSVFLDVTMRVDRGDAGARSDAGPSAASP